MPSIEKHFVISATSGLGGELIKEICNESTNRYHLYTDEEVSNKNMRFFVTEYIREQAYLLLNEELPYELAVVLDEYHDGRIKDDGSREVTHIAATILVNRPSQRGIVVGSKGSMIKSIGVRSREKIENLLGGQINLNLHVKVSPRWFKNNFVLESIGLPRAQDSNRVWRKK